MTWAAISLACSNTMLVSVSSPATWAPVLYEYAASHVLSLPPYATLSAIASNRSLTSSTQSELWYVLLPATENILWTESVLADMNVCG